MIRKLKNIGIAIVAVLAMGALSAPSTSAAEFHTGWVFPLDGEQALEDVDKFNAGWLQCKTISYTGELRTSTANTLTLTPSYSGCTAFGFSNTTVTTNSCKFVFHTSEGSSADISCPSGKSIVISAFNCEVTLSPQANLKTVSYTNEEAEGSRILRIGMELTGLSYIQHPKSFPQCAANGTNPFTNGIKESEIRLEVSDPEVEGIWYE